MNIRVDQICTGLRGGAAIAARRLHQHLCASGLESRFWYAGRSGERPPDATYRPIRWSGNRPHELIAHLRHRITRLKQKRQLQGALRGRDPGLEIFTQPRAGWATPFDTQQFSGDILNLHWVAGLLDYSTFFSSIPAEHPIVWTLHDMNPMTGGCHYSGGCHRFEEECGHCPQLGKTGPTDLSHQFFKHKQKALATKSLHLVSPSRWLLELAKASPMFESARGFHHIPNSLDLEMMTTQDRCKARQALNLPLDQTIVGFGAEMLTCHRKGGQHLAQALGQVKTSQPWMCLTYGGGEFSDTGALPPMRHLGYLSDRQLMVTLLSAIDLFVMPSLEDNLPQTGMEAMACGKPVVAFDTGGVVEYVRHEQTGLLAEKGNTKQLASCITRLIEQSEVAERWGTQAREMICREFSIEQQVDGYTKLYQQLCDERQRSSGATLRLAG